MSYLQYFREIPYPFNGSTQVKFQDISQYADIIDSIKDEITAYTEYYVLEGDRPDNLSQKLYRNPRLLLDISFDERSYKRIWMGIISAGS